jgi:hypothetical protein
MVNKAKNWNGKYFLGIVEMNWDKIFPAYNIHRCCLPFLATVTAMPVPLLPFEFCWIGEFGADDEMAEGELALPPPANFTLPIWSTITCEKIKFNYWS